MQTKMIIAIAAILSAAGTLALAQTALAQNGDPSDPSCRDECNALGAELKAKCIGADGNIDQACVDEYLRTVEACYAECGDEPPPPPPPPAPTCQERCALLERDLLLQCTDATTGVTDPECMEKVKLTVAQCLESCNPQPPPEPGCREKCDALAVEMKQKCVRADGTVDEACLQEYERTVTQCYAECGEPNPPPPPDSCQARCSALENSLLQGCTDANGVTDPACLEKVKLAVAQCYESCNGQPPGEPTCRDKCGALAADLKARCARDDGTVDEACLQDYERIVAQCYADCGDPEPPPPPPPGTCEEKCSALKLELLLKCAAPDGTVDAACVEEIERTVTRCLANCVNQPPPPQPTCREACDRLAGELRQKCITAGGQVDEGCLAEAAQAVEACYAACDNSPIPPPPVPCDQDCLGQSEGLFKACVAAGETEDECRARSDAILGLCLERCSDEVPCESRCALAAQVVLVGASLAGLSDEESRRIANSVLESCVAGCKPQQSCPERCQELVATSVRECLARGGSEEECKAKGEEVRASCEDRCAGNAVPPCDDQCDAKAEAMVKEWTAQGLSQDEAAAKRDAFLEECRSLLGESCAQEAKADLTAFRGFERGDTTRDGRFDITDPIATLAWLFQGGPPPVCEDAADSNDDGALDLTDPVLSLESLFKGAGALPEPYSRKGQDPTADALTCAE